jgi:hypothetical protein
MCTARQKCRERLERERADYKAGAPNSLNICSSSLSLCTYQTNESHVIPKKMDHLLSLSLSPSYKRRDCVTRERELVVYIKA